MYRVVHTARYTFGEVVRSGATVTAHLDPRGSTFHQLVVRPLPVELRRARDGFGNTPALVTIAGGFGTLRVTAISVAPASDVAPPSDVELLARLLFPSPRVPRLAECEGYARSALEGAGVEALERFVLRVRADHAFDARAAEGDDSLARFVREKRGVCQDFAHFTIGCLRAAGVAACYASGYVARPTEGGASHAWVAAHLRGEGWVALDPTLGRVGPLGHITLGFGRDHGDVALLSGEIAHRGACGLSTSVTIRPA